MLHRVHAALFHLIRPSFIPIFSFSFKVVVRCSLVAFQDKKSLTSEIKIKGLFLSIWRHIQSSAADHMNGYGTIAGGGFNTYKGALLRGTQLLNEKFVAAWTKDNYCDYLAPLVAVSASVNTSDNNGDLTSMYLQPSPVGTPSPKKSSFNPSASLSALDGAKAPAVPPATTLTRILRGDDASKSGRDRSDSGASHLTSSRSRTMTSERPDFSRATSQEIIAEDMIMKVGVDNIATCDNFLVPVAPPTYLKAEEKAKLQPGFIRVKISDNDVFDDGRITTADLRELLHAKPHIAELLYDALVEESLVQDERIYIASDEQDDGQKPIANVNSRLRLSSLQEIDDDRLDTIPMMTGGRSSVAGRSSMAIGERSPSMAGGSSNINLRTMTDDSEFSDDDGDALRVEDLDDDMLR